MELLEIVSLEALRQTHTEERGVKNGKLRGEVFTMHVHLLYG